MAESKIKEAVAKDLSSTPFACSSLTQLSGGTANFLYRGVLSQPLPDGTSTIIVKHAEDYLASNADFELSAERCVCSHLFPKYSTKDKKADYVKARRRIRPARPRRDAQRNNNT